ncbi:MAG: YcaO-like family protein [Candidatus Thiodiazotropha endolucinida]
MSGVRRDMSQVERALAGIRKGFEDCARGASAEELWPILPAIADRAGITRLGAIGRLDCLGVEVWQAIRPDSRNYILAQGKGVTASEAVIGAVLESHEMFCSERIPWHIRATPRELSVHLGYDIWSLPGVDPSLLEHTALAWTQCEELPTGRETFVPTGLVRLDYRTRAFSGAVFKAISTGLATGISAEDSTLAALLECLERHVTICFGTERLALDPIECPSTGLRMFIERIRQRQVIVKLYRHRSPFGVSVVEAIIEDPMNLVPATAGTAARLNLVEAVRAALLEAAQSRATLLAGARDDLLDGHFEPQMLADTAVRTAKWSDVAAPQNCAELLKSINSSGMTVLRVNVCNKPVHVNRILVSDLCAPL